MQYVHPFPILDGDREAMEFAMNPGSYNPSLATAAQYQEGDLVTVDSNGQVAKATPTTATAAAAAELFEAGADYHQPFAMQYLLDRGVPLNVIPQRNQYVMTYQGDAIDGADFTLSAGNLPALKTAVAQHARRDVIYNATEGCLTVRNTSSANSKVTLLGFFGEEPQEGDTNPRVIVRIDTGTGA